MLGAPREAPASSRSSPPRTLSGRLRGSAPASARWCCWRCTAGRRRGPRGGRRLAEDVSAGAQAGVGGAAVVLEQGVAGVEEPAQQLPQLQRALAGGATAGLVAVVAVDGVAERLALHE